jgi:hypothetical protein
MLDNLPGAFGRGFIVRRIGQIVRDLAVVPLPRSLGGDDSLQGFRLTVFFRGERFVGRR